MSSEKSKISGEVFALNTVDCIYDGTYTSAKHPDVNNKEIETHEILQVLNSWKKKRFSLLLSLKG